MEEIIILCNQVKLARTLCLLIVYFIHFLNENKIKIKVYTSTET